MSRRLPTIAEEDRDRERGRKDSHKSEVDTLRASITKLEAERDAARAVLREILEPECVGCGSALCEPYDPNADEPPWCVACWSRRDDTEENLQAASKWWEDRHVRAARVAAALGTTPPVPDCALAAAKEGGQ
jgi:hypothetical protein